MVNYWNIFKIVHSVELDDLRLIGRTNIARDI